MKDVTTTWGAPLLLSLLCATPFFLAPSRDAGALLKSLRDGDCAALAVLAAHHPEAITPELMRELSTHEDLLLRELVAHQGWIPHVQLREQLAVCATLEPLSLRDRAKLWTDRRTTSRDTLTQADLATYWQTRKP